MHKYILELKRLLKFQFFFNNKKAEKRANVKTIFDTRYTFMSQQLELGSVQTILVIVRKLGALKCVIYKALFAFTSFKHIN